MATNKLMVKCEDDPVNEPHPHCPHGPTLLFYRQDEGPRGGYYACAAHRDQKECRFHLPASQLVQKLLCRRYKVPIERYRLLRKKLLENYKLVGWKYCHDCEVVFSNKELINHKTHSVQQNLLQEQIQDPTTFLRPLCNDSVEAQYFFNKKTLDFFVKCIQVLNIKKVVCMGAPRLHAHLRAQCDNVESFLLDIDQRFFYFYTDDQFAWFNMCNNHFYDDKQREQFKRFLKCEETSRSVMVFTDPPFGSRTETIANTLQQITNLFNTINKQPHQPLSIFWIFPYFFAPNIRKVMPHLNMSDYKVNYLNHANYSNEPGARKFGSPVRIFTNVPLEQLILPVSEEYKYCSHCRKYMALENRHCAKCNKCPALNGSTYRHCEQCGVCVKPYYVHCADCRRCTQAEMHSCKEYQSHQSCWICLQLGHTEHNCAAWKAFCMSTGQSVRQPSENDKKDVAVIRCLLCGKSGHNELNCLHRKKYVNETTFMGETELSFLK